jgi:hypothetical protein
LENFKGVLTYGSPLEKFAAIWPAHVPVNKTEPHFPAASEWINSTIPSIQSRSSQGIHARRRAGPLRANAHQYRVRRTSRASAHLRYLNLANGAKDLGDAIAHWVLGRPPLSGANTSATL